MTCSSGTCEVLDKVPDSCLVDNGIKKFDIDIFNCKFLYYSIFCSLFKYLFKFLQA